MTLGLRITSGPMQGKEYKLKDGDVLGRGSPIRIEDAKVSVKHAKVQVGLKGELILVDLDSTNGIRVNKRKLSQITLVPGLIVQLGNTVCEIFTFPVVEKAPVEPPKVEATLVELPPPVPLKVDDDDEATLPPIENPLPAKPKRPAWQAYMMEFTQRAVNKVKDKEIDLSPFRPAVVLTFERGPQLGTEWVLGFGPRQIGAHSIDLQVVDPEAPAVAFSITPKDGGVHFRTDHPEKVRLNNQSRPAEELKEGDIIAFSQTVLKVGFRE